MGLRVCWGLESTGAKHTNPLKRPTISMLRNSEMKLCLRACRATLLCRPRCLLLRALHPAYSTMSTCIQKKQSRNARRRRSRHPTSWRGCMCSVRSKLTRQCMRSALIMMMMLFAAPSRECSATWLRNAVDLLHIGPAPTKLGHG